MNAHIFFQMFSCPKLLVYLDNTASQYPLNETEKACIFLLSDAINSTSRPEFIFFDVEKIHFSPLSGNVSFLK